MNADTTCGSEALSPEFMPGMTSPVPGDRLGLPGVHLSASARAGGGSGWYRISPAVPGRNAELAQPHAVRYYEPRRQGHRRGADQRVAQAGRGDWNGRDVVAEGPAQVLPDRPHRGAGQPDRLGYRQQVIAHDDDVGRADRDVSARAQRDPEIGGR